jgi:hypothetical protein
LYYIDCEVTVMANEKIITLRVSAELKKSVRAAAKRSGRTVSAYIRERLEADLDSERNEGRCPCEAERAVLKRFIGGIRHGGLTRNIDESLYGKVR